MNTQKLTQKSLEAIQAANGLAVENQNQQIEQVHLLSALLEQEGGLIPQLFEKMGVSVDNVQIQLKNAIDNLPAVTGSGRKADEVYVSQDVDRALREAEKEAARMKDDFVSVEHLVLGLFDAMGKELQNVLKPFSVTKDAFLAALMKVRGNQRVTDQNPEETYDVLAKYGQDLVERARAGKLDPVIGRDNEIRNVIRILSRKTKNNPVLIGEPGVGKTAIAEGIALRIHSGNVPMHLKDKQVYLLDLTSLVAGTQFRGQFESRVKGLLAEVKQEGNIILFIDEVHNLVGAGNSEGAMNAANILKPALSRGEVQVIGATTFEEYRKYIEKDSALERRFQPVTVNEPTVDETIEVLNGIAKYYESYHRVHISPEMIRLCAVLSERYITDRFLPDKAIDLLDESCACTNLRSPEIEAYDKLAKKKEELEAKEKSIEDETEINFEELAQVKGELIRLNTSLEEAQKKLDEVQVTADDLSKVIELWTGIPAHKIAETEFTKLAHLEDRLKAHIIGQDEAVESLAKAIKRTRVQLSPRRRPASFIFVGPTGVGKTELVKVLSQELFDSNDPLIRLDMTEFMEKHSVARMIGSPPGYVGYDEAGQLTEKIRRRPYSVVLFDEIEKAHPDVLNSLLQILDDGRLTDAQGRVVSFENTVIVMTSNAGSQSNNTPAGFGRTVSQMSKDRVMKALEEIMRPEFLNRIDEIIAFNQLSEDNFRHIAEIMLGELRTTLADKDIRLTWDDSLLGLLTEKSYSVKYGARNLRRLIEKEIENPLATAIVAGDKPLMGAHLSAVDGKVKLDTI